jgi:inner membrane transporter RhtA
MGAARPAMRQGGAVRPNRIPAVWLVVAGICSVQFGAVISKGLFGTVPPTAMVWLRLATSAIVLLAVARPRLRAHSAADWRVALAFGVCLMGMNWAFYQSFARIPLGLAVTIEFLGPLTVSALASRRPRDLLWVALATIGVGLLGFSRTRLDPLGVVFGLVAALGWACYILLSKRTGQRWPGISGLAIASLVGAVVLAPPAIVDAGSVLLDPRILLLGLAVGLLSSVVPYSLELTALRTIPPRVFGILMSLEPAVGALTALVLLAELLGTVQWLAMACVVVASVGSARASREPGTPSTA